MGPKSGYDIKQEVEDVLGHFWHESYGNIYPVLKRLHESGLATRQKEVQEGRPDRNVYTITDEGMEQLRNWLAEPVEPSPPRNELLLKLFFGRYSSPTALSGVVAAYRERAAAALERLEGVSRELDADADLPPDATYWRMTLELGLRTLSTIAGWADDTLDALNEMKEER